MNPRLNATTIACGTVAALNLFLAAEWLARAWTGCNFAGCL